MEMNITSTRTRVITASRGFAAGSRKSSGWSFYGRFDTLLTAAVHLQDTRQSRLTGIQ